MVLKFIAAFCVFRTTSELFTWSQHVVKKPLVPSSHVRYMSMPRKRPQNDRIEHRIVQLVDPETERLRDPVPLKDILASIDLKTHVVELVSELEGPVVKIFEKKELFRRAKENRARRKANRMEQKEVQMTWGVAPGDLIHKLMKVRRELEKGNRVELVYAPKKDQTLPTRREMEDKVQETVDLLADAGQEWRPRKIEKNIAIMSFQNLSKRN
jgi:translation initiation factor IF-3